MTDTTAEKIEEAPPFPLSPVPPPEPTEAEIEIRFQQLVDSGEIAIHVDPELPENGAAPGRDQYIIARSTFDKAEAVLICDRFQQIHQFERIKSVCFVNGMIDGIRTYMREAKKLGPLKTEAVIKVGNSILQYLDRARLDL